MFLNDSGGRPWGLDGAGNFATFNDQGSLQTRSTNGANEITAITGGSVTPTYDAAGNMISGPKPGHPTTARVHYDGLNRRTEKLIDTLGLGDQYYYNRAWQVIEDRYRYSWNWQFPPAIDQYVYGAGQDGSLIVDLHDGDGDGNLSGSYWSNWRAYATTDANHNVTATFRADSYNTIQDTTRNVYTPYGALTTRDGPDAGFDGPLYCGYFYDVNTGLYQVRNRYYDPGLSTWISRDPMGFDAGDTNVYRYLANSPTDSTDPSGEEVRFTCRPDAPPELKLLMQVGNRILDLDKHCEKYAYYGPAGVKAFLLNLENFIGSGYIAGVSVSALLPRNQWHPINRSVEYDCTL